MAVITQGIVPAKAITPASQPYWKALRVVNPVVAQWRGTRMTHASHPRSKYGKQSGCSSPVRPTARRRVRVGCAAQPGDINELQTSGKMGYVMRRICWPWRVEGWPIEGFSNRFLYKAGPEAACANFNFFCCTFYQGSNGSKVWAKHSLGAIIRVTDIIAD